MLINSGSFGSRFYLYWTSLNGRLLPVGENRINSCADSLQSTHFGLPDYYYKSLNTNNLFQFILNINETAVDPKATVIDF